MTNFRHSLARNTVILMACMMAMTRLPVAAQSLTTGGLTATVLDERGKVMTGVNIALERGTSALQNQSTDSRGMASFPVVLPGRYALLIEQLGYRPLRLTGILVIGGSQAAITAHLATAVPGNTVDIQPAVVSQAGGRVGRVIADNELSTLDYRRELTDVSRGLSEVDAPRDGRSGFVASANGQAPGMSSLVIDGIGELLMRQPALRSEPATAPLFSRNAFDLARVLPFGRDAEWSGAPGAILTGSTRSTSGKTTILPWFAYSGAKLGGRTVDNPGDSTASSFEGGFRAGGGIKSDTGAWMLQAEYRQLATPSANPFEVRSGATDPTPAIQAAAQALGHGDIAAWLAPTVRTWKGGNVLGRLDWQFNRNSAFALRAAGGSWNEDNPQVGTELSNGAGTRLEAKDLSIAGTFSTSGEDWLSETRIGARTGERNWSTGSVPYTGLAGEQLALGGSSTVPGNFKERQFEATESYTYRAGAHQFKAVGDFRWQRSTNDWLPYGTGRFDFGDVASFAAARGAFVQATRTGAAPTISVLYPSLGVQDRWQATPRLQLTGGFRVESQRFSKNLFAQNVRFAGDAAIVTSLQPSDGRSGRKGVRGGFLWTADASGTTTLQVDVAKMPVHLDLGAMTEVLQSSNGVNIHRATGVLPWPNPLSATTPAVGPTLTFFNANTKSPRALKSDVTLTRRIGGGLTIAAHAGYDHTDYLLRRADLNLIQAPLSTAEDGRPIYGTLEQYGSLLTPAVGSNRRFRDFDKTYMLSSSGFAEYTEFGVSLEHQVARGFSAQLSYTWSKATDNIPGQMSNDPADQLSPFPGLTGHGTWDEGRSDFDVPSRFAATAGYASGGVSLSARFRYRSGLPFTPAFGPGVDANGDGAAGNDPAPLGSTVAGLAALSGQHGCLTATSSGIAERNSCRDPAVNSLDLHLGFALPFGGAHAVSLLVDAFNVVSTDIGQFDHAAVTVDPSGTITFNSAGQLVLPLKANDNFGKLLSRRGEPRMVRIGFRVEN